MRRHVIPYLILTIMFFSVFLMAANTPWLINHYGAQMLEDQFKGLKVGGLHVSRQRFRWSGKLVLSGVEAQLTYKTHYFELASRDIAIIGPLKVKKDLRIVNVKIRDGFFKIDDLAIKDIQADLTFPLQAIKDKVLVAQGDFQLGLLQFFHYEAGMIEGKAEVTPIQIQILDISANAYGGKIKDGQVSFQREPVFSYVSWAELIGLDGRRLRNLNKPIFAGLTTTVDGTWRLVGDNDKVEVMAIILNVTHGGVVPVEMLKRVAGYVHNAVAQQKLNQLVAEGKSVAFDNATVYIQNVDPWTAALILGLESKSRDIHIQERILVPIKSGLRRFLTQKPEQN